MEINIPLQTMNLKTKSCHFLNIVTGLQLSTRKCLSKEGTWAAEIRRGQLAQVVDLFGRPINTGHRAQLLEPSILT